MTRSRESTVSLPPVTPLGGGTVAIAVAEDSTTVDRALDRCGRLLDHSESVLHVVLNRPPPGPGVLVTPDIAWVKLAETRRWLNGYCFDQIRMPPPRVTDSACLVPLLANLIEDVDASAVVIGRPSAWAPLARNWWSGRTTQLQRQSRCQHLLTYPDAYALLTRREIASELSPKHSR